MLTERYQWQPEEYTDDGKPKIDDAVLKGLEYPEAKVLAEYYLVAKRIGQVAEGDEAWLKRIKPNGRIHGGVTTNGAVTGRMTHSKPNLAQVPKVKYLGKEIARGLAGEYGFECRDCFGVPGGRAQVGADAAALELRDLAGYMARWDGGAYVRIVLDGKKEDGTEIHTVNRKALEIDSRDDAKTWFYAFLYGAGDEKLGLIVTKVRGKEAQKRGKQLRAKFLKNLPALGALVAAVKETAAKRGYLIGLDGRRLHVRSQHSALNTLLQSAGAIQMKKALVILEQMLQSKGFKNSEQSSTPDYEFILNVHDEWQIETKPEIADEVGRTAVAAIRAAGEHFKFPCPLDGEYKIGRTWAETH
jgi:DNA polymerase-1